MHRKTPRIVAITAVVVLLVLEILVMTSLGTTTRALAASQPQLGVMNSVPTPSGAAYQGSITVTVTPGSNAATTDTGHAGLFTIFFTCTSCTSVQLSGATFYLYLSEDGFSVLSPGDVLYAGPFFVSDFSGHVGTLNAVTKSSGYGNGTYYIGTTNVFTGCASGCQVVEGPIPTPVASGFAYVKVYDGSALASVQTLHLNSVTTTTSSMTTTTSSSSSVTSTSSHSTATSTTTSSSHSSTLNPTTTTIGCTPSPVVVGMTSTCTATVTGVSPTGTISFSAAMSDTATPYFYSGCTLSSGACTITYLPNTAQSPVVIKGSYGGDPHNSGSSGSFDLDVSKATTSTSVTCVPSSAPIAGTIQCTATVNGFSAGGDVQWTGNSGATFSPTTCTLASGTCTTLVGDTAAATPTVTASFEGDSNNQPSQGSKMISFTQAQTSEVSSIQSQSQSSTVGATSQSSSETSGSTSGSGSSIPEFPESVALTLLVAVGLCVSFFAMRRKA